MAEINNAITEVKLWLHYGWKEKVIGYFLLFLVMYGAIFELIHPFALTDEIHSSWVIQHWWMFQLSLSVLITSLLFYLILPLGVLQKFSFYPSDTRLDTCWKDSDGNPKRTVITDGLYGKVLQFSNKGGSDCEITHVVPRRGNSVTIICKPQFDFVVYLLFKVSSANGLAMS